MDVIEGLNREVQQEGLNKEDVEGTPTKPPKEEIVINAIQCPEEEDEEWCMRMDVIEGLNREVQQEEAMQEFQAKQGRQNPHVIREELMSYVSNSAFSTTWTEIRELSHVVREQQMSKGNFRQ
ncbi:hypothetical protein PIB30_078460 [Stylosanthes scabra]|uniref:Uncharacterized protein n=1 Tax=Stylosanthes scabra TaxID=79078 RepID=A0ABU6XQB8_9FABA|nr:hypothetical protein [Stylosanthes scabra]